MKQADEVQQSSQLPRALYAVDEVANILGVSERTIYRWISEGNLPIKRIGPAGRLIRITDEDLVAFINRDFVGRDEDERLHVRAVDGDEEGQG